MLVTPHRHTLTVTTLNSDDTPIDSLYDTTVHRTIHTVTGTGTVHSVTVSVCVARGVFGSGAVSYLRRYHATHHTVSGLLRFAKPRGELLRNGETRNDWSRSRDDILYF